jgi:hypothetical protein
MLMQNHVIADVPSGSSAADDLAGLLATPNLC